MPDGWKLVERLDACYVERTKFVERLRREYGVDAEGNWRFYVEVGCSGANKRKSSTEVRRS